MKPTHLSGLAQTVAAVLLFVPIAGQAQSYVNCGVKAGGSLLRMSGDGTQGTDIQSQTDFMGGALLEIGITENVAIQPEVVYISKGIKTRYTFNDGVNDGLIEETNELSYLQFPVLAKLRIPAAGRIVPSLFAGPSVAVNLGGTSTGHDVQGNLFPWNGGNYGWDGDIANLRTLDFGAIIGGDLAIPVGRMSAFVDFRYDFSFASALKEIDNYGTPSYDPGDKIPLVKNSTGTEKELKNRAVTISAGLVFPL